MMNRDDAEKRLARLKDCLLARIPADQGGQLKKNLAYLIGDHLEKAGLHLRAIYERGQALGPGLSRMHAYAREENYAFSLSGIRRHLRECGHVLTRRF